MSEPEPEIRPGFLAPGLVRLFALQVVSGMLVAPLFSLFPIYVERNLGFTADFSGNLRAFFVLTSGIMAFFGGAACDSLGRKPAYLLGMTAVVTSGALFLLRDPFLMTLGALYSGLMFGLGSVAGQTYLLDLAPEGSLAQATAWFFMTGTVGNALGSAAGGWVARNFAHGYAILGWTTVIGHLALIGVAALVMPATGRRGEAVANQTDPDSGFTDLFRRREVWALLALRLLPTFYWGAATLLMPLLIFRLTHSEAPAGYYTSASLVLSAVCQVAAGRFVDTRGPARMVPVATVVVAVAALGQWLGAASMTALWAAGLLGAGAAWSLSVSMTTLVRELSTEATRGRLLGVTHVAWSFGFLAGNLASGYLDRAHHAPLTFAVAGAGCLAAALCALVVVRRRE